jgi:uncharacterized SAM-binding protein YcdF (DUF218 family)
MYFAYKLVQLLLRPELWIFTCLIGAWFLSRSPRRLRSARWLLSLGILLFYVLGITPTGAALCRSLESQYRTPLLTGTSYDAVVVLAGGNNRNPDTGEASILGTDSVNRVICGLRVWHQTSAPALVLSGGVADPLERMPPDADAMREFALESGGPATTILTESRSRHTAESATEVRRLLPQARRIVLVTHALHLPRSTALFRKQGFEVTPFPCTYFVTSEHWSVADFVPSAGGLQLVGFALHEYVGMAVYRILGRI